MLNNILGKFLITLLKQYFFNYMLILTHSQPIDFGLFTPKIQRNEAKAFKLPGSHTPSETTHACSVLVFSSN